MRQMRLATGIVLIIVGTIWLLQGLDVDFAPQSFMTGNQVWIWFGAVAVLIGGSLVWARRSR